MVRTPQCEWLKDIKITPTRFRRILAKFASDEDEKRRILGQPKPYESISFADRKKVR